MKKAAVIYWSGTGNTESMAQAVAEGIRLAGGEVSLCSVSEISPQQAASFDALALGCPSMGCEILEESEFEPFFTQLETLLADKPVVLFGSYGWGDGQWMRDWEQRLTSCGGTLRGGSGLTVQETPSESDLEQCRRLGSLLIDES